MRWIRIALATILCGLLSCHKGPSRQQAETLLSQSPHFLRHLVTINVWKDGPSGAACSENLDNYWPQLIREGIISLRDTAVMINFGMTSVAFCTAALTEKGRRVVGGWPIEWVEPAQQLNFSAVKRRRWGTSSYYIPSIVSVTGIRIDGNAGTAIVQFIWGMKLTDIGRILFPRGISETWPGSAQFKLWDDGWRVESVSSFR